MKIQFGIEEWEIEEKSRCFIHLANTLVWREITGETPPTVPYTAKEYNDYGLPWFDYYDDNSTALKGSEKLKDLKSVVEMGQKKGDVPVPYPLAGINYLGWTAGKTCPLKSYLNR